MVALGLEVDAQVLQAHVDELRRGSMLDESGGTTTSLRDHMDTSAGLGAWLLYWLSTRSKGASPGRKYHAKHLLNLLHQSRTDGLQDKKAIASFNKTLILRQKKHLNDQVHLNAQVHRGASRRHPRGRRPHSMADHAPGSLRSPPLLRPPRGPRPA